MRKIKIARKFIAFAIISAMILGNLPSAFAQETRVATYISINPTLGTAIRGQMLQMDHDLLDQVGNVFDGSVVWTVTGHNGTSINATGLLATTPAVPAGTVLTVRVAYANDLTLHAEALITVINAPVPGVRVFFNANPASGAVVTAALADGTPVLYGQEVPRGTRVTFTGIVNNGYTFINWSSRFGDAALEAGLIITDNAPAVHTTTLPINMDTRIIANVVPTP